MDANKRSSSSSDKPCATDRVSRIRRMLEDGDRENLFSPHYVSNTPWDIAAMRGATTNKKKDHATRRVISEMKLAVLDAFEDGDKVVVRWRMRGKWTQPFAGVKPTGQPVDVTGMSIYRFVGDRIVEESGEVDMASFATQAIGAGVDAAACAQALRAMSRPPEVSLSEMPVAGPN